MSDQQFYAFPKIFSIGDRHISKLFDGPVEVTEKVDGSQIAFTIHSDTGELMVRSKGAKMVVDAPEKMFIEGVEYLKSIKHLMDPNVIYYGEYLKKPKHNTLAYDKTPRNHIALFGIYNKRNGSFMSTHIFIRSFAVDLDIDTVPLVYYGLIENPEQIHSMIDRVSFLGGQRIEGVVIKNYAHDFEIGGKIYPLVAGKYVSEAFKEVHQKNWKSENTGKGKWELFCEGYKTQARWNKAIIHLQERGEHEGSVRDIGKLIKEVQNDIIIEEEENIKSFLWNNFKGDLLRTSIAGLPQWYKDELLKEGFYE